MAHSLLEAKAKWAKANPEVVGQFELAHDLYTFSTRELEPYEQLKSFAGYIKCDLVRLTSAPDKL